MAKAPADERPLEPYQELEHQLSLFARRARALYGQLARALHPELEPAAYGLLVRVAETGLAVSLALVASTLPVLKRITGPETARNE